MSSVSELQIDVYNKIKQDKKLTKEESIIFKAVSFLMAEDYTKRLRTHHYITEDKSLIVFNNYKVEYLPASRALSFEIGYVKRYKNEDEIRVQELCSFEAVYYFPFESDRLNFSHKDVVSRLKNTLKGHFGKNKLKGVSWRIYSAMYCANEWKPID